MNENASMEIKDTTANPVRSDVRLWMTTVLLTSQCGNLRDELHDPCHGDFLRRIGPDHCRNHGMEEKTRSAQWRLLPTACSAHPWAAIDASGDGQNRPSEVNATCRTCSFSSIP